MATLQEMAEAHLLNVQREIQQLTERKGTIDQEIERLHSYLQEGKQTLVEEGGKVDRNRRRSCHRPWPDCPHNYRQRFAHL